MADKGFTIWFTGLSASGKTTVSRIVDQKLREAGHRVELLDGDVIRNNFSKGLGFSKEDRDVNVLRLGFVCHLLSRNGVIAIAAAISPYADARGENRELIGNYVEVYVDTPLEECERRDPKGLYKKARAGRIENFTGVSDPYEEPVSPEISLDTVNYSPGECAAVVIGKLSELGYLDAVPESVYTAEEEELVKKRLEDLGYI